MVRLSLRIFSYDCRVTNLLVSILVSGLNTFFVFKGGT